MSEAQILSMKVGNRLPIFRQTLYDEGGGVANLAGCTVQFRMGKKGAQSPKVLATADIVGDPTQGVVEYQWAAGDTDTAGEYRAEWIVSYSGLPKTYPSDKWVTIRIVEPA